MSVMLPVASSLTFATRMGTCSSGNGYFGPSGGFFTAPGVLACGSFEAERMCSGIAGTRNVRVVTAWSVVSRGEMCVNGSIGQGLSGEKLVRIDFEAGQPAPYR